MELTKHKLNGKYYLRLRLRGLTIHETETTFCQVEYFENMYKSLYRLWSQEEHKAVINRWATFQWLCQHMNFPMETGAHAAIFTMVNSDVYF